MTLAVGSDEWRQGLAVGAEVEYFNQCRGRWERAPVVNVMRNSVGRVSCVFVGLYGCNAETYLTDSKIGLAWPTWQLRPVADEDDA